MGVVLPFGTQPDEIPERLKLYEKFRYERASNIQEFSRIAGKDHGGTGQVDSTILQTHCPFPEANKTNSEEVYGVQFWP